MLRGKSSETPKQSDTRTMVEKDCHNRKKHNSDRQRAEKVNLGSKTMPQSKVISITVLTEKQLFFFFKVKNNPLFIMNKRGKDGGTPLSKTSG